MPGVRRVAIIGCGKPRASEGATGFGMAHQHWQGYEETGVCTLAAAADTNLDNARAFVEQYKPEAATYADYRQMLAEVKPDIVSICTWPSQHAPMVLAAIEAGAKAVHCEKPMAPSWGEAVGMHRAAATAGVQLTFNHQRRFLEPFWLARNLLRQGVIGEPVRMEASCPNLLDWGTHWLDIFFFYNNDLPVRWVMGQIDCRSENLVYGLPIENQGFCQAYWSNGVRGLLFTGDDNDIGCQNRLVGTHGYIEVHDTQPHVRYRGRREIAVRGIRTNEDLHAARGVHRAVADLVSCLEVAEEPALSSTRALRATELIFATYQSSRRRSRIDLPLDVDNSELDDLLRQGGDTLGRKEAAGAAGSTALQGV